MTLSIGQIKYNLFQINETDDDMHLNVDAYLYIGEERAVLIDALQETEELYDAVRRITDRPLELLITHGHPDHAGKAVKRFAEEGIRMWMSEKDFSLYQDFLDDPLPAECFSELQDGQIFDLGGIQLETIMLEGHTPGSAVFLDRKHQYLFAGDAIGSGHFWMQIPGCLPLHNLKTAIENLLEKTEGMDQLAVYPGHRWQSPVQLNRQYIKDTLKLTEMIMDDPKTGKEQEMSMNGKKIRFRESSYGMMLGYCYNPENL